MKKLFCFLAVAATAAFTSCSSDDDSGDNGGTVTGITLNASSSTVTLGDTFTFTVNNNLDENVTSSSTIYVDDTAIEGNTYTATEAGTYTVHAVNGDFTSEDVTVTVTSEVATALTVAVSAESIAIGEEITFTAATDISDDVTGDAVFYVNGTAIEGNTYTATEAGEYEVYATLDELTSEVVTFMAIEATEADNKIHYNEEEFDITNTALVAWGGWNEDPNATEATHILWSIVASDNDNILEVLNGNVDPNTYMDIEFVTALGTEGETVFPTTDNITFLDIYEVMLNGTSIEFENSTEGNFALNAPLTAESTTTSFTLNGFLDANSLNLNYDGTLEGFYAPQGRGVSISTVDGNAAKASRRPLKIIMLKK